MCLAVYLACSRPLPPVPWNASAPAFHLVSEAPRLGTPAPFSLPFAHYAGSHQGCGCGFLRNDGDDPAETAASSADYAALAATVRAALAQGADIELFACWEGEQDKPPARVLTLSPGQLERPDFALLELDFIRFVADV